MLADVTELWGALGVVTDGVPMPEPQEVVTMAARELVALRETRVRLEAMVTAANAPSMVDVTPLWRALGRDPEGPTLEPVEEVIATAAEAITALRQMRTQIEALAPKVVALRGGA